MHMVVPYTKHSISCSFSTYFFLHLLIAEMQAHDFLHLLIYCRIASSGSAIDNKKNPNKNIDSKHQHKVLCSRTIRGGCLHKRWFKYIIGMLGGA